MIQLMPHQEEVLDRLSNGKILKGGVGSGKSVVAFAYYMEKELIGDIYVITTAKKRDSLEWQKDAAKFGISTDPNTSVAGQLHIDSWNNIGKYTDIKGAFFIFDEQRLVGSGTWVRSFLKIAKNENAWLILTATPGDNWMDFAPVFIANGHYKNRTAFLREHVVYSAFTRFPKIDRYVGVEKLEELKEDVLVHMPYLSPATRHVQECRVFYNEQQFQMAADKRWNIFEDKPIQHVAELFAVLRKIVYSDHSRLDVLRGLMEKHPKLIVFYNFNYELDVLRELYDTWSDLVAVGEWNGHKKDPIPDADNWVYLVQYAAGAEGWNCVETDAMVFYSPTYSYKQYHQAQGRIDRLNTSFTQLYYYVLLSTSMVDKAVMKALSTKKSFNEKRFAEENLEPFPDELDPLEAKYGR